MGMILKPPAVNVLDQVKRKEVAVLVLEGVVIHVFGDYDQIGGDIVIRIYLDGKPTYQYSARDEAQAREIIGRVVLEQTQLWKIAS